MTIGVGFIGLGMATKPHMTSLRELEAAGRVKIVGGSRLRPNGAAPLLSNGRFQCSTHRTPCSRGPISVWNTDFHNTRHASSGRRSRRQGRQTHHR